MAKTQTNKAQNKPKTKPSIKIDPGTFLLVTGALANVTLWIGAFVSTEAQGPVTAWIRDIAIPVLGGVSGVAMGITVSFGLVYVFSALSKMQPTIERKKRNSDEVKVSTNFRFWFAVGSILMLLIISPALLFPYVLMLISGAKSLYEVLGSQWGWLWSVGRVVAADLALGAIALVHGVHVGATAATPQTAASDSQSGASKPAAKGSANKNKPAKVTAVAKCRWCEFEGSQNAVNAHVGRCKFKPTISMPVDVQRAEK